MRSAGLFVAVVIATVAWTVGCGGSSSSGQASCTISESVPDAGVAIMLCEEYSGLTPQAVQSLRQSCMLSGGLPDAGVNVGAQFEDGPCSHVNALGGCRVIQGGMTATIWYYADASGLSTSADIQMLCAAAGATFIPP
jgi:hypothetical protein